MQWINEPPAYAMKLKRSDPEGGTLELTGPAASARVKGGIMAAVGATFTTAALPFFRNPFPVPIPIPLPLKLIPLAVSLVGGGVGALGIALATGQSSVLFKRSKGVRFRWKLGMMRPRELFVPAQDIAQVELSRHEHHTRDKHGFSDTTVHYQLHVVTTAGKAIAFESFSLHAQAKIRQQQIEDVLRPASQPPRASKPSGPAKPARALKTAGARKPAGARKTAAPQKRPTARKKAR